MISKLIITLTILLLALALSSCAVAVRVVPDRLLNDDLIHTKYFPG